jgi:hypothetical protein
MDADTAARSLAHWSEDGRGEMEAGTWPSGNFERFLPGARPGEPIATALNPIASR